MSRFLGFLFFAFALKAEEPLLESRFVVTDDISDVHEIVDNLNSQDMYITDFDDVLVRAVENIFPLIRSLFAMLDRIKDVTYTKEHLASIILRDVKRELVSPEMPNILQDLKIANVPFYVLTACGRGSYGAIDSMEKWREDCMASFGLELPTFSETMDLCSDVAVSNDSKLIRSSCYIPGCRNGIIYTCNTAKDIVLRSFLERLYKNPNKIVFIDDEINNVRLIQKLCLDMEIEFVGIHYTASRKAFVQEKNWADKIKYLISSGRYISDDEPKSYDSFQYFDSLVGMSAWRSHVDSFGLRRCYSCGDLADPLPLSFSKIVC